MGKRDRADLARLKACKDPDEAKALLRGYFARSRPGTANHALNSLLAEAIDSDRMVFFDRDGAVGADLEDIDWWFDRLAELDIKP